ncbi:MAG: hypothetical protein RMN51_08250 [Verrucomicrobiota bacterium]|nr:hypothetical protein [Limisphaera sp.]MDW8382079.1 hypothetical protein [Verrucomicrobiota bacterium]
MNQRLTKLILGWMFMSSGAWVMLEAGMPLARWPRSNLGLGLQGLAGFGLLALGCWLRRCALRPSDKSLGSGRR